MSDNIKHQVGFRVQKYGTATEQEYHFVNTFADETATEDVGVRYVKF